MTLISLSTRELNEAAHAATQTLRSKQDQTPITAHTPYMTFTELRSFVKIYGLVVSKLSLRRWLGRPSKLLIPYMKAVLATDAPQRWCYSLTHQRARGGMLHIIPMTHLSEASQLLAQENHIGRSFAERLSPDAKVIFDLLVKHSTVPYATAKKHCRGHLPRSTFFYIKKRLLSQERNFPWKPSSSPSV